jgi:hypothetical protein
MAAAAAATPNSDTADAPPDFFAAMQQQLGLKVESAKAPVQVMVIDTVERPGENRSFSAALPPLRWHPLFFRPRRRMHRMFEHSAFREAILIPLTIPRPWSNTSVRSSIVTPQFRIHALFTVSS